MAEKTVTAFTRFSDAHLTAYLLDHAIHRDEPGEATRLVYRPGLGNGAMRNARKVKITLKVESAE